MNPTEPPDDGRAHHEEPPLHDGGPAVVRDPDLDPERPIAFVTRKKWFALWLTWHIALFFSCGIAAFFLFLGPSQNPVFSALLAAAAAAAHGSAFHYLRKTYRTAIQGRLEFVRGDVSDRRQSRIIGTVLYLTLRPAMAAALSVFASATATAAWYGIAPVSAHPTHGLVQLAAVSGFLIGFFSGRSFEQLESSGRLSI